MLAPAGYSRINKNVSQPKDFYSFSWSAGGVKRAHEDESKDDMMDT